MMMSLFLTIVLRDEDDHTAIIDALVNTLTQAKYLKNGERLHFEVVHDTILCYRSFPTTNHRPAYESVGGD